MEIAKSGRKYRSIPEGFDVDTWDKMTFIERLKARNLLIDEPVFKRMTQEEYEERLQRIKDDCESQIEKLRQEFVESVANFEVGDILHSMQTNTIIRVTSISGHIPYKDALPEPIYLGETLNKDLTPRKKAKLGYITGDNYTEKL